MVYPKNDKSFQSFVVGRVVDRGDHWELHAQTGRHTVLCPKSFGATQPKVGWHYRVYDQGGNERGCYVGGRKPFYRTSEQHREWTRATFGKTGLSVATHNPQKRQTRL